MFVPFLKPLPIIWLHTRCIENFLLFEHFQETKSLLNSRGIKTELASSCIKIWHSDNLAATQKFASLKMFLEVSGKIHNCECKNHL